MRTWSALLFVAPMSLFGQMLIPDLLTELPGQLNETSGLLVLNGHVWTILDSGNPAAVYEVDPADGSVLRTVELLWASNVDFEDITADANWVYIGDFGNNAGARTDLRIYVIPRWALEEESTTGIEVDTITFSFEDQSDFTPAYDANNFDCEAFVAVDDSLFLFTKRWLDERTRLYALPALPGDHVAEVRGTFDTGGLITSAAWDGTDRLVLLGHENDPDQPFIWLFNSVEEHDFLGATGIRREVDLLDHQTEGIAWNTPDEWIISNELASGFQPTLWSIEVGQTVLTNAPLPNGPRLFPQPAGDEVRILGSRSPASVRLVDQAGREVEQFVLQMDGTIDLCALSPGVYIAWISDGAGVSRLPLIIAR